MSVLGWMYGVCVCVCPPLSPDILSFHAYTTLNTHMCFPRKAPSQKPTAPRIDTEHFQRFLWLRTGFNRLKVKVGAGGGVERCLGG